MAPVAIVSRKGNDMKQKIIFIWLTLFFIFLIPSFSQSAPDYEKKRTEVQQQIREMQKRALERIQKTDPKTYREVVKRNELSQKIDGIVASFRRGSVTEGDARKKLLPLVRESLGNRIENLDKEIERLTKQLDSLKKAKANPDFLVNQQVNRYLGKDSSAER